MLGILDCTEVIPFVDTWRSAIFLIFPPNSKFKLLISIGNFLILYEKIDAFNFTVFNFYHLQLPWQLKQKWLF